MNDQEKRVKLAEAMGLNWKRVKHDGCDAIILQFKQLSGWTIFNPFTNANDDHAVLEWMRRLAKLKGPHGQGMATTKRFALGAKMRKALKAMPAQATYQIGNNARAALKAIRCSRTVTNTSESEEVQVNITERESSVDGYCGRKSSKAGLQAGESEDD